MYSEEVKIQISTYLAKTRWHVPV